MRLDGLILVSEKADRIVGLRLFLLGRDDKSCTDFQMSHKYWQSLQVQDYSASEVPFPDAKVKINSQGTWVYHTGQRLISSIPFVPQGSPQAPVASAER